MRIVSWNCKNGLDGKRYETIKEFNADIYVIQKCQKCDFDNFKENWKYGNWYGDDLGFGNSGIAIFSNNCKVEFSDEFNRNFRYIIPYRISIDSKQFTLFAVWTQPVPLYYDENLKKAINYLKYTEIMENSIIIGDFNTRYNNEHEERYKELTEHLENFINCAIFSKSENKSTYFSDSKNKSFVNDFCFVSKTLYKSMSNVNLKIDDIWNKNGYGQKRWKRISDHCPIILTFDWNDDKTEFIFDSKVAFEVGGNGLSQKEIESLLCGVN